MGFTDMSLHDRSLVLNGGIGLSVNASEERACLGDVDLGLTVGEIYAKLSAGNFHAIATEENVANNLSLSEASVGDILMNLTVDLVGKGNEEFSTGEGIKGVIDPLLREGIVNNSLGRTSLVKGLNILEEIVVSVEVVPHDLAVERIVAASKALLRTVVEEGDASCSQSENECALEESLVAVAVQEASVIMVVHEKTECIDVLEVLSIGVPSVGDHPH